MNTPDVQEKPWLVVNVAPKVGRGNVTEVETDTAILKHGAQLQPDASPKLTIAPAEILNSGLTQLAQFRHAGIAQSAPEAIGYAKNNDKERNSLPAQALRVDMAMNVMSHVKQLLKKHHLAPDKNKEKPKVAIVSPQDMTIESLVLYGQDPKLTLALFLICPDVFGKFDPEKSEINNQIVHLFWNAEAYAKALETLPPEKVKLIMPPDPLEAFPVKPSRALAEGGKPLIKLSGSGGDATVISAISAQLTQIGLPPTVVCENANKLNPYTKKQIATESDPSWYYHSLGEANVELPPYLICFPSEQVKHLIVLQQKGIFVPTVFLYPKGLHEARNLAWAIKQGVSKVVCVPKTLPGLKDPQAEVAKLLAAEGVEPSQYRMVDPSEITQADFEKPTKVWEQPPKAQSLFDTVRTALAGTSCVVKA